MTAPARITYTSTSGARPSTRVGSSAEVAQAGQEGSVLLGGERLTGGIFDRGYFVAPTVARLPPKSGLFRGSRDEVEAGVCYA